MFYFNVQTNNNLFKECTTQSSERVPTNIPQFEAYIRSSVDVIRAEFSLAPLSEFQDRDKNGGVTMNAGQDYENLVAEYLRLPFPYPAPYTKNA